MTNSKILLTAVATALLSTQTIGLGIFDKLENFKFPSDTPRVE
jgi:hypothetical protein